MTLKKVPSFSARPGFPTGLQVLLMCEEACRDSVEAQLRELNYIVTTCADCPAAVSSLAREDLIVDIVLAEAQIIQADEHASQAFLAAAKGLPLVLMSGSGGTDEVMKGIELGAVDFLERPLSPLKLRNIWQHVVRKMMVQASITERTDSVVAMEVSTIEKISSGICTPSASFDQACSMSVTCDKAGAKACDETSSRREPAKSALFHQPPDATDSTDSCHAAAAGCSDDKSAATCKPAKLKKVASSCGVNNRPPLAIKPPGYGMQGLAPMVPTWPQSAPGCVWGTPLMGQAGVQPIMGQPLPPPQFVPNPGLISWQAPLSSGAAAGYMQAPPLMVPCSVTSCSADFSLCGLERSNSLGSDDSRRSSCDTLLPGSLALLFGDTEAPEMQKPPIGLQLKKSASFLDLINSHLNGTARC